MYEKSPIITTKNIRSFIKRISKTIKKSEYGFLIILVSFLAVAVLFELFVFNFRHWQTLFHEPLNREPVFAEGYSLNGDGGGIYYRYTMDIALFFTVSAVSVSIGLVNSKIMKNKFIRNNLVYILLVIFLFEFIYCMCTKLSDEQFHTLTIRQDIFYKYMFMYGFWM